MSEQEFEEIVDNRLKQVKELLLVKGKEYRRNGNPFHNFERGSEITGEPSYKILDGFLSKHLISYRDILNDMQMYAKTPSKELISEKWGDIITYFCIQEALIIKNKEEYDKLPIDKI